MRTVAELQDQAWRAILAALGPADALRYRALLEPGRGDYAREREELLGHITLEDWIATFGLGRCPPSGSESHQ